MVRVGWRGAKDESKEVLELVRVTQLTPRKLATARGEAMELETRAYSISKDVWGRTDPARRRG